MASTSSTTLTGVKAALQQVLPAEAAAYYSEEWFHPDLEKLYRAGYGCAVALRTANKDSLTRLGIAPALLDALLAALHPTNPDTELLARLASLAKPSGRRASRESAQSPTTTYPLVAIRKWIQEHSTGALLPPPSGLPAFVGALPLERHLRKLLMGAIFAVPRSGLFALAAPHAMGFRRDDQVDVLRQSLREQHTVVLLQGLWGTGKSFSLPHSLVEALLAAPEWAPQQQVQQHGQQELQEQAMQPAVAHHWQEREQQRQREDDEQQQQQQQQQQQRVPYIAFIDCTVMPEPQPDEQQALLALLAFLGIPCLLDEYTAWQKLTPVMKHMLERGQFGKQRLRPLQFVLCSSVQQDVTAAAVGSAALFGMPHLDVSPVLQLPLPRAQLLAGMVKAFKPEVFAAGDVLSAIKLCGCSLAAHAAEQLPDVESITLANMTSQFMLDDLHMAALAAAVQGRIRSLEAAPLQLAANVSRLMEFGLLEQHSNAFEEAGSMELGEPRLLMMQRLQKLGTSEYVPQQQLQLALAEAEGRVLKLLARKDLLQPLLQHLQLQGNKPRLLFGNMGAAELDLCLLSQGEPAYTCLVSCKRSQGMQDKGAFTEHIRRVENQANNAWRAYAGKVEKGGLAAEQATAEYDSSAAVRMMRSMVAQDSQLHLVVLSAKPTKGGAPAKHALQEAMQLEFEGTRYKCQGRFHDVLLEQVLQPQASERLTCLQSMQLMTD